jgi:hypothetical protein
MQRILAPFGRVGGYFQCAGKGCSRAYADEDAFLLCKLDAPLDPFGTGDVDDSLDHLRIYRI